MPPVGIKNKNYLNVKNGATPWLDAGGKDSKTDPKGHAVFSDAAWGVRAGILLLRSYFFKHNRRTIAEILSRWAPASDTIGSIPGAPRNSPANYSKFVAGRMRLSYNDKLEIFNEDRSIGNIGQLRDLFFAMAAYEIGGGFEVPLKDFNAGLELVQPGIKTEGTETHTTNTALEAPVAQGLQAASQLSGSVGRPDKGAANAPADVETVQQMLRNAAMILRDPRLDPGGLDGQIEPNAKKSPTVAAILAFQSRFFTRPDGVIEPGGRTWLELVRVLAGPPVNPPAVAAAAAGTFFFPFSQLPSADWTSPPRSFAAQRDNGRRAHAGCDLYFPTGTVIHSVANGTVVRGPYPFYAGTYALEIDHGTFIARYGEIQATAFVRKGDRVQAGQAIARVGHLAGVTVPSDMLHFELYDKSADGPLTVPAAQGAITPDGRPYMRRRDLIDPTPKLNAWKTNLPRPPAPAPTLAAPAAASGSGVPTSGFCIYVQRKRQERRGSKPYSRTIGDYECFWNGSAIPTLKGQIVERGGPGDNTTEIGDNRNLRIKAGSYPLAVHHGTHYKTIGYNANGAAPPKPGLLLRRTEERTAILIHPGVDYISSVGCLNPSSGLTDANSKIDFNDSRQRVIAIIDEIKTRLGNQFPSSGTIPGAVILITGEPQ